jgi:hypothetical protein
MNIKNSNSIFKYGRFELVQRDEDIVVFRRILKDESLLCIVNRDKSNKDINVISNAHSANIIFGDCEAKLDEGLLKITNKNSEIGLIIHEQ